MASHQVGHNAVATKERSWTYSLNRSRWPCGQVRMLTAAREELVDSCLEDSFSLKSRLTQKPDKWVPVPILPVTRLIRRCLIASQGRRRHNSVHANRYLQSC